MPPVSYNAAVRNVLPPIPSPGQYTNNAKLESATDAITAFAGGGQGSAVALASVINRITVVATAADSVKLPAAVAGMVMMVINSDSADSANVFPSTGENINDGSANAAFALAAGKRALFFSAVAAKWHTILTA